MGEGAASEERVAKEIARFAALGKILEGKRPD